jgi:uncharacterized protein YegP (UPF0339 family)
MSAQFEVFQDQDQEWRWRLRASNGEILATSESYTREADAKRGIADMTAVVLRAADVPIMVKSGP